MPRISAISPQKNGKRVNIYLDGKFGFGIDLENNFEPQYIIPTKAKKNVTALKKLAGQSEKVILATDEDREGEGDSQKGRISKDPGENLEVCNP